MSDNDSKREGMRKIDIFVFIYKVNNTVVLCTDLFKKAMDHQQQTGYSLELLGMEGHCWMNH